MVKTAGVLIYDQRCFEWVIPDVVISENDKNKYFIRISENNKQLLQHIPEH